MTHHEQHLDFTTDTQPGLLSKAVDQTGNFLKEKGRRLTATAAATALAISLAGCGVSAQETPPETDPKGTTQVDNEPEVVIPAEAQEYVDMYSDRYIDPLATYYAEKAFVAESEGALVTIGQEYIDSYSDSLPFETGEVSPIGLSALKFDFDQEINAESMIAFFNEATPVLNHTLNLLAKNPTPAQVEVIRDQFSNYPGISADTRSDQLVYALHAVTAKYGSAANYSVNPFTTDSDASNLSNSVNIYENPVLDAVDENGKITAFSGPVDLSILVELYDNKGEMTQHTEVVEHIDISVRHASDYDPMNIGYVGIGAK